MTRTRKAWLPLALLTLVLAGPSLGKLQKYLGAPAMVGYLLALGPVLWWLLHRAWPAFATRCAQSRRTLLFCVLAGVALLTTAFAVVYPIADSGVVAGGSDRDEALDIAVEELLNGRYPYHRRTEVSGPHALGGTRISPLPGSFLLATPFVLFGASTIWFELVRAERPPPAGPTGGEPDAEHAQRQADRREAEQDQDRLPGASRAAEQGAA